ncbi:Carboxylesterase, type B [Cystobacter fuscus DSM 2262]|uniref:Carboxylic ester hydrolase n=2 Tax=Cystobacter fuscus TaxID=43 RepID=S9PJW5_CYSF2|nr:Carboxylesterase, type B [Cystobacter fuscus DSM 2262]
MQNWLVVFLSGGRSGVSEDCLYLNVWTPTDVPDAKLPVLVYIQGGAFAGGVLANPTFDGARLAREGNILVVTIPHRLGALGFLASPELSRETGHGSGTWALQDIVAGLEWVRDNIGAFGGDPGNVTLSGQSSGATASLMLAAAPPARGLFHRVISESGGAMAPARRNSQEVSLVPTLALAESEGSAFLASLGASDLKAARELKAEDITGAQGLFWPVADGYMLPDDPAKLYASREFHDTPILAGWNADDGLFPPAGTVASFEKSVRETYGPAADAILEAYPHTTDAEAAQSNRDLLRDQLFGWPTYALARAQTAYGRHPAFIYYLERKTPSAPNGAPHGVEAHFIFGNGVAKEDEETARAMRAYFVNFARTGDPNGPGLAPWPTYSPTNEQVMGFAPEGVRPYPHLPQLLALDRYYEWLRTGVNP